MGCCDGRFIGEPGILPEDELYHADYDRNGEYEVANYQLIYSKALDNIESVSKKNLRDALMEAINQIAHLDMLNNNQDNYEKDLLENIDKLKSIIKQQENALLYFGKERAIQMLIEEYVNNTERNL